MGHHTRTTKPLGRFLEVLKRPPRTLFEDDELHVRPRGPLFSRRAFRVLLVVFGVSLMLSMD